MEGLGLSGDWEFLYQGKEFLDFNGGDLYDFNTRSYDAYLGRFWQLDGANQFASGYVGMGNMPTVGVDPDGQLFYILPNIGISGGKLSLGITFGIGLPFALNASVSGGYDFGQNKAYWSVQGQTAGFYAGIGSSGGFVGWGSNTGPINFGVGYSRGGLSAGIGIGGTAGNFFGGLGVGFSERGGFGWSGSGGYGLMYDSFGPLMASNDPIYSGGNLDAVYVTAKRNTGGNLQRRLYNGLTYAGYGELGLSATQLAMKYRRSKLPIHSKVGSFSSFTQSYSAVGKFAKGAGALSYISEAFQVRENFINYQSNELSGSRFTYKTMGSLASIGTGMSLGSRFGGPYGAMAGGVVSGAFLAGEFIYDNTIPYISQAYNRSIQGFGSLEYSLKKMSPR